MITELGRYQERAWLKDFKQKQTADKSGWEQEFFARIPIWKKKKQEKPVEDKNDET